MSAIVKITRTHKNLGHPEAARLIKNAVNAVLKEEGIDDWNCIVEVTLTDEEIIRTINREERKTNEVTDVLSFPQNDLEPGKFDADACVYDYDEEAILLGDMMLCIPRCEQQAAEYGHSFRREVSYLAVHSALHLLGYDHVDEGPMKARMRAKEEKIMEALSIPRE
ncbi:MAG: rRNA maturation RNase YbeY [bacterium]